MIFDFIHLYYICNNFYFTMAEILASLTYAMSSAVGRLIHTYLYNCKVFTNIPQIINKYLNRKIIFYVYLLVLYVIASFAHMQCPN
jgi:hypothetical protein